MNCKIGVNSALRNSIYTGVCLVLTYLINIRERDTELSLTIEPPSIPTCPKVLHVDSSHKNIFLDLGSFYVVVE